MKQKHKVYVSTWAKEKQVGGLNFKREQDYPLEGGESICVVNKYSPGHTGTSSLSKFFPVVKREV